METFVLSNTLNMDVNRRDEILFGSYEPEKYLGGIRSFECNVETMRKLIDERFADPDETQNDSPSIGELMSAFEGTDIDVTFGCYAVSPERSDYRITIESADVSILETDYDNLCCIIESFRWADEFNIEHIGEKFYIHAWWD